MRRVSKILKDAINQSSNDVFNGQDYDCEALEKGIERYIEMNHLEEFETIEDEFILKQLLTDFMSPVITRMSPEMVVLYFTNYELISKFLNISKRIEELALQKKNGKHIEDCEIESIEKEYMELLPLLYRNDKLKDMVSVDLSECILDLNYIKGKSDLQSIRISTF